MQNEQGENAAMIAALDRFSHKADQLLSHGNNSFSKVEINAGGIGVWISVTCCLVMISCLGMGGFWLNYALSIHDDQIMQLQNGEKAVRAYITTGRLKPEEKKDAK